LIKRIVDVSISLLLLLLFFPMILITAVAVRMTSPGQAFYKQPRVGLNGRIFHIFKFRTMRVGADKQGPLVTSTDDSRTTDFGRFIRRSKLDEVPQLLNVLRGDMSLVGPRPQVPAFVELFEPNMRREVLSVLPGVTGITALCFRHEESMLANIEDRQTYYVEQLLPRKLEMDAWYVRNCGVQTDLFLLGATASLLSRSLVRSLFGRAEPGCDERRVARIVQRYVQFYPDSGFPEACDPTREYRSEGNMIPSGQVVLRREELR
jgi:lipopolysaccharide/colanic/teichoic acid biosynthesis glycosyltransferase